jgi:hypothetical protein
MSSSRPQAAKRHLDRARQYFWKSVGLLRKGVQLLRTAESVKGEEQKRVLKEGSQALQDAQQCMYVVQSPNSQNHIPDIKTALSELYEAYKLIRDYEMNPLPPITFTGEVNVARVAEDEAYWKIMGTDRMEPNRLGIGQEARGKWREKGYWDYNYYPGATTTPENDQLLYHNVGSDAPQGPKDWAAYQDWKRSTKRRVTEVPLSLTLQYEGYWPRVLRTDTSQALCNIHQHFFAPVPPTGWEGNLLKTDILPYAVPGESNNNPRWNGQVALFYPSGVPEYGVPVCENVGEYWDARVACNFLKSPDGKQAGELLKEQLAPEKKQTSAKKPMGRPVNENETCNILLQHALFLLCAPTTPWMKQHLPRSLWITEHSPTQYQRTSENIWPWPPKLGWSGEKQNLFGPLSLDENFGKPGHIPGPGYVPEQSTEKSVHHMVWLVRTQQEKVCGEETWGLDFL